MKSIAQDTRLARIYRLNATQTTVRRDKLESMDEGPSGAVALAAFGLGLVVVVVGAIIAAWHYRDAFQAWLS